ncbi:MAG: glycosyltransferase [Lachnospiraceae bacterium]|nr:glycosyltransferase [Lachnospiraceae bacterium]
MNYMEAYLLRMTAFLNFKLVDYKKDKMPLCHITKGYFEYKNLNMCFVNDMISRAAEALYQGYLPVIEVSGGEGIDNLWSTFFKQPAELLGIDINERKTENDRYEIDPVWGPGYKANLIPRELECAKHLYKELVVPNDTTKKYIENEYKNLLGEKKVLGVLFRGTDLGRQRPADHPVQPDLDVLLLDVEAEYKRGNYDCVFFTSDEEEAEEFFHNHFSGKIITNKKHYLNSLFEQNQGNEAIIKSDFGVYLTDIMDAEHVDFYTYGIEYLSAIFLLSKCQGIIAGNTLGSSAALFLNNGAYEFSNLYDLGFYKSKVSVIIPCYNREAYIGQCLDSLIHQTYGIENMELILINDGSTDATSSIIKEYETLYPESILVINLEEQSGGLVGKVRNVGLSYASGKYVTFVDSDDVCMDDLIEKLVAAADEHNCDCVGCGAVLWNGEEILKTYDSKDGIYDMSNTASKKSYLMTEGEKCSVWARIYRRDFIEEYGLCFDEELHTAEDVKFHFRAMAYAKKIVTISDYLYLYRASEESLVRKNELPKYFMDPFWAVHSECRDLFLDDKQKDVLLEWEYLYFIRGICEVVFTLKLYQKVNPKETKEMLLQVQKDAPNILQNPYISSAQGANFIKEALKKENQSSDKLISIIVPVYNGVATIQRCLDSLLHQTLDHSKMEIILVDDCSTDETYEMLVSFEKEYPDLIRVYKTPENLRVGGARNLGIKEARGTYVGFVDADDWVEPVMYEHMLEKALTYDCDVVNCRHTRDTQYEMLGENIKTEASDMGIIISNDKERADFIVSNIIGICLAFHIYRRSMLIEHNILSPEKLAYEDNVFDPMVYLYASRIYLLEEKLYHYYVNPDSIVLALDKPYHKDFFEVGRIRYEEYKKRGAWEKYYEAVSFDYLMGYYVAGLKVLALRYSEPQVEQFRTLQKDVLEKIPDAISNPYLKTHATKMQQMQVAMLSASMTDEEICDFLNIVKNSYQSM